MIRERTITKKEIAGWTRWLHIYLSMFSFGTLLFFAVTGVTLNHPGWIEGKELVKQVSGEVKPEWVTMSAAVDELKVVEHFRNSYAIKARVSDFVSDETECRVSFKGPGFAADAFIDRSTATYELTITQYGVIAIMNDLHKGRDSGGAWAWLIDVSAVLMIVVSLTGFVMIYFLRKRRLNGTLLALAGALVLVVLYYAFAR